MTSYHEILRLKKSGLSGRDISRSTSASRNTVSRVCSKAEKLGIQWPLPDSMTDKVLKERLFPNVR